MSDFKLYARDIPGWTEWVLREACDRADAERKMLREVSLPDIPFPAPERLVYWEAAQRRLRELISAWTLWEHYASTDQGAFAWMWHEDPTAPPRTKMELEIVLFAYDEWLVFLRGQRKGRGVWWFKHHQGKDLIASIRRVIQMAEVEGQLTKKQAKTLYADFCDPKSKSGVDDRQGPG
jgi:hypothetical protein